VIRAIVRVLPPPDPVFPTRTPARAQEAGGWKRTETLMRHWIQADAATMLQVLDEPLERQA